MADQTPSFGGLFRTDLRNVARTCDQGLQWDFRENDLNDSTRALFRRLDKIFQIRGHPITSSYLRSN
jgi:hypothetical protein